MQGEAGVFQFTLLPILLTIIGLYGIYIKLGYKSRLAFVPYINLAKLGYVINMPIVGTITALLGIIDLGFACTKLYVPDEKTLFVLFLIEIIDNVLLAIFRTILLNGLRKIFDKGWGWIILFLIAPGLTLAIWGYSKRIQMQ